MLPAIVPTTRPQVSLVSLVTVGNIGAGKSFLLNTLLGCEQFAHRVAARPVTREAEHIQVELNMGGQDSRVNIWNLQGIAEPRGAHADRNRAALSAAFQSAPRQVVIFVARHNNGRLRHEDVALFVQLMRVYHIRPESTIVLFNRLPAEGLLAMQTLFCRVTEFCLPTELVHCAALRTVGVDGNREAMFTSADACFNADVVRSLLARCAPVSHKEEEGMMVMLEEEQLEFYRRRIAAVQTIIEEELRRHKESLLETTRQQELMTSAMKEADRLHAQNLAEIEEAKRQSDLIHEENVHRLHQFIAEMKHFQEECHEAEETAHRAARKEKTLVNNSKVWSEKFVVIRSKPHPWSPLLYSYLLPLQLWLQTTGREYYYGLRWSGCCHWSGISGH